MGRTNSPVAGWDHHMLQSIWYDLTNIDNVFGHLTYLFLIASISMTNMRWLRIFALLSGVTAMLYFILRTEDRVSFIWEAIFTLTNAAQLALLLHRSRASLMSPEERRLIDDIFAGLDGADRKQLLGLVDWQDAAPDTVLMQQGQKAPPLLYIAEGAAVIEHGGRIVGACGAGDFLGEISHLTGEAASATVRVTNSVRYARFDMTRLTRLMAQSPPVRNAFDMALNQGLAAKVLRMNTLVLATAAT